MPGQVRLVVTEGPMKGKEFCFDEHDTFLFGRLEDCHICLPNDAKVSRHHFLLEVNPPEARIRDLGSMNGTHVNGKKCGGREQGETPDDGAKRRHPEVDLKDGDRIQVGDTTLVVHIKVPIACCQCGCPIADGDRPRCGWIGGTFICPSCRAKLAASIQPAQKPEPPRCEKCGKDVSTELGGARRGSYVCQACRQQVEADPAALVAQLLQDALRNAGGDAVPSIQGYELRKKLGEGGMGAVYLARRKADGREVAIKVMLSKVAVDEQSRQMFQREMDVVCRLEHENIVEFYDQGSIGTAFYFVMEFCNGGSVDGLMECQGGRLPAAMATPIVFQALQGLAFAHRKNFVHRDLKPQNILLAVTDDSVTTKVTDFGLAKNFQKAGFSGMTVTGSTAGTPAFMPREQVTNFKHVKPASDVWSMGATFYAMLTGMCPREFRPGQDPMEAVLRGAIIPIRERDPAIPPVLAQVIDCAGARPEEALSGRRRDAQRIAAPDRLERTK